jgi:hypothetical protein
MISRLARTALKAKTSIPRTGSAFRSFHVSTPPQDDDKAAAVAEEDDSVGNDGVLGTLFGNPYYSVPLCGLGVMTATASDFYILDAETQLLGLWCMFVGTCYHNFGDSIAEHFDGIAVQVQADQNAQEDLIIGAMEVTKRAHVRQTAIYDDIQAISEAQKVVMAALVTAKSNELGHLVRNQTVGRLDAIANQESRMTQTIQRNLVDAATAQVRSSVQGDRAKTMALENAFAAIADPNAPVKGKEPVSAIYSKFFSGFNARLSEASGDLEVSAELKAEMEEQMKTVAQRDGLDWASLNISAPTAVKL